MGKKSNQVFDIIQIMHLLSFSFKSFLEIKTHLQNIESPTKQHFLRELFCQKQLLVVRFWFGAMYHIFNDSDLL